MPTFYVRASRRDEVEALIRSLPAVLAGRAPDPHGIGRGFRLRMAFAFFSVVKEEFIVKSRGGTDAAGIKWRPLSREYLAYQRPMGRNGSGSRQPPRAGGLAPGGHDGFMSQKQLKAWRACYAHVLNALVLKGVPVDEAKGRAAATAWARAKKSGVRTKLDVFGSRDVEILRDRGILFNSLSPGVVLDNGPAADYSPPTGDGGQNQVVRDDGSSLLVGTNVDYAERNHRIRPLWPPDGRLPQEWWDEILDAGVSGLLMIGVLFR